MIKMPLARAKAATASFPTLLEEGSVFLRILRTHATGGSNSTAEGGPEDDDLLLAAGVVVVDVAVAGVVVCCGVGADGVSLFAAASVASAADVGVLGGTGLLEPISFVVAEDDSTSPPLSPTSILSSTASGTLEVATVELIIVCLFVCFSRSLFV